MDKNVVIWNTHEKTFRKYTIKCNTRLIILYLSSLSNFPLGWWWDKVKLLLLSSVWSLYWWFWTDNSVPYFLTTILYWSYLFSKTCINILSKKIAYCILKDAYYVLQMVHGKMIRRIIFSLDSRYSDY